MPKLHKLLAESGSYRTQAESCRADLENTFEKKHTHFTERRVTDKSTKDGEEDRVQEQLGIQTTVAKEWRWIVEKLVKTIDNGHQIDVANMTAKADVMINGRVLLKDMPATSLLQLEKRLEEIQHLVQKIPTLDPTKGFEADEKMSDNNKGTIYKARDKEVDRTEKKFEFVIMVPATEKLPAQIKEMMNDKKIGTRLTQEWSGMITTGEKGNMLDRVEELLRAIKRARSDANDLDVDVSQNHIAQTMLDYIYSGKL